MQQSFIILLITAVSLVNCRDPLCGSSNDVRLLFQEAPLGYHVGCINEEVLNSFLNAPDLINEIVDCWISGNLCENDIHKLFIKTIEGFTEGFEYTGGPVSCNHLCGDKSEILEKAGRTFRRRHGKIVKKIIRNLGDRI